MHGKSRASQVAHLSSLSLFFFPKKKIMMRDKNGEKGLWDGEFVKGCESKRENQGQGKAGWRVIGKELWVRCEQTYRKTKCLKGPNCSDNKTPSRWSHWILIYYSGSLPEHLPDLYQHLKRYGWNQKQMSTRNIFSPTVDKLLRHFLALNPLLHVMGTNILVNDWIDFDPIVEVLLILIADSTISASKPLWPLSPSRVSKNSGQIFSKEIMKFLKLLGRETLYHLLSLCS